MPLLKTDLQPPADCLLLIVDGHAYAYRAYHAIRALNAPDGEPANAIFGFVKMLLKLHETLKPTHLLVVWDGGLDPERVRALPEYKAQRPPTPDALERQLPRLTEWLAAMNWPSLQEEHAEADDWIATYARRASSRNCRSVIASSDKDFMQLVEERIGLFNPNDKEPKVWTSADVEAKAGVQPGQIVDWLSLVGDAVDNIPGVPGVGPKTAADLLRRFGSAEGVLSRLTEIKADKLRSELLGAMEHVRRNQAMVRLKDGLQGGPEFDALRPGIPKLDVLKEFYQRWGFKSLLSSLGPPEPVAVQGNLF